MYVLGADGETDTSSRNKLEWPAAPAPVPTAIISDRRARVRCDGGDGDGDGGGRLPSTTER